MSDARLVMKFFVGLFSGNRFLVFPIAPGPRDPAVVTDPVAHAIGELPHQWAHAKSAVTEEAMRDSITGRCLGYIAQ
jgi:hypothetical protein